MAFADGALDAVEAERIRAQVAADPAALARIELFRATRGLLSVYDTLAVPRPGDAWEIARTRRAGHAYKRLVETAVAACLCVAVGLLSVLHGSLPMRIDGESLLAPAVARTLEVTPAGGISTLGTGATLVPLETFASARGTYCRSFELSEAAREIGEGYACRIAPGRWRGRLPASPQENGAGSADSQPAIYVPASGLPPAAAQLDATRGPLTRLSSDRTTELLEYHWMLPPASTAYP